jgi:hypothetical protein
VLQRDSAIPWRWWACLTLVRLAGLLFSCARNTRKPVFPVHGEVYVNGKPAVGAKVFFIPIETDPDAVAPYGVVDAEGSFALTTYLTFDGAPEGKYVVTIRWPGLRGGYDNPKTSKLTATVEKAANDLPPFQLMTK